jgi:AAA domain-containing protein/DnaB helicase-like protein
VTCKPLEPHEYHTYSPEGGGDDLGPRSGFDAEAQTLAAMLILGGGFEHREVQQLLPRHFEYDKHRRTFAEILACREQGQPIDATVLAHRLHGAGTFPSYEEASRFLLDIVKREATGNGLRTYADTVRESFKLRRAWEFGSAIMRQAQDGLPADDIEGFAANFTDSLSRESILDDDGPLLIEDLAELHKELRPAVLHGLLRQGEVMNIIAPPKTGKSWLVYQLLLSMATGRRFLGFLPEPGAVALIDNELHKETLSFRIPATAKAMALDLEEYRGKLHVKSLRGKWVDIYGIGRWLLSNFKPGELKLAVIDSWYRALPKGANENDPGVMAEIYNYVDTIADKLGCAIVNIHHSTKGSQASKAITDVGSGSGVQSRAADAHFILRQHEHDGVYVGDGVVRSWSPIDPFCARFTWPLWSIAEGFDPAHLKQDRPRQSKSDKGDVSAGIATPFENRMQKVREALANGPLTKNAIKTAGKLNTNNVNEALNALLEFGEVETITVDNRNGATLGYQLVEGVRQTTSDNLRQSGVVQGGQTTCAPLGGAVVLSGVDVTGAPCLLSGFGSGDAA